MFRPDDPIELIGGQLIVSEPQSSPHYTAIGLVEDALKAALGPGWLVRPRGPIALDDESEPEPDVTVVSGDRRTYSREHPARPVLVVEVALSSLAFDRHHKGSVYARARLEDYWILNLVDRALEIYRQPVADASAPFGWRYDRMDRFTAEAFVTPLVAPAARIAVRDMLP